MSWLREYVLQLTASALICSIALTIFNKKDVSAGIIRLICGFLMLISLFSPLVKIKIDDIGNWSSILDSAASDAVDSGQEAAYEAISQRINTQIQAYILDEARELDICVEAEVYIDKIDGIPTPYAIRIKGDASPYARMRLQSMIRDEIGIPLEDQMWIN